MKITQTATYDDDGVVNNIRVKISVSVHMGDAVIVAEDHDPKIVVERLKLSVKQIQRELDAAVNALILEEGGESV